MIGFENGLGKSHRRGTTKIRPVGRGRKSMHFAAFDRPDLNRVLEFKLDLVRHPVTAEEELFVHFLILHLRTFFKARLGLEFADDIIGDNSRDFLSRPIPHSVWKTSKKFQDRDFVNFVETNLNNGRAL